MAKNSDITIDGRGCSGCGLFCFAATASLILIAAKAFGFLEID